jgi:Arc/MetJ-type ribon-helix-helix transcriptional regulator
VDDQITVRLPTQLGRTLRRTSRRLGRRPSHVVRMALEAFLQEAPSADKRAERRGRPRSMREGSVVTLGAANGVSSLYEVQIFDSWALSTP